MNPEQQLIAIAEACGWRCTAAFKEAIACWVRPNGMDHETESIPDYLNDLNAMREAEESLFGIFGRIDWSAAKYETLLTRMTNSWAWHATATQRAEAFLRTIGKWEESK